MSFIILFRLSQVEEMLVSGIMPIMSIYQLPLRQYGYKGHVINLPQDVTSFACTFPKLLSKLEMSVRTQQDQSHRDFRHYNNHITSLERIDIRGLLPAFPR